MKRMVNFLEKISKSLRPLSLILSGAGILAGLAMIGGCSLAGWSGALAATVTFLIILTFCIFFVGSVYLLTRMSDDLRAIRTQSELSAKSAKAGAEGAGPPTPI